MIARSFLTALLALPLGACTLVTTPVKVAGSVAEHAIDAVSPFDDDDDDDESDADRERDRGSWTCSNCGHVGRADDRFCSSCGRAR